MAGVAGRLAAHATWTSAATHPILPLLATAAGVRLQLATGIAAHRARSGAWGGGLWLPECAHAPWLDPLLEEAGVRAVCVDLTDVLGAPRRPLRSAAGPLLVPLDRPLLELVWSAGGYPSRGAYRDTHRLTARRHQAWAVAGGAYEPERAAAQARADAAAFVRDAAARVRDGGLATVAVDTELLGLHWHEGPQWLAAVLEEAERAGLRIAPLDELLGDADPAPPLPVTSWGAPRDLDDVERPRRGRARVAPARRGAARARGRPGRAGACAARAARAAVLRLGVPRQPPHRGRLPARARRRPRGGVRRGAPRRGAAGAARARPAPRARGAVRSLTGPSRRIPSARVVCSPT